MSKLATRDPRTSSRGSSRRKAERTLIKLPSVQTVVVSLAVIAFALAVLTLLSLVLPGGKLTSPLRNVAIFLFGAAALLTPFWLAGGALWVLYSRFQPSVLPA